MQEEIEHKTVNFAISTVKLSARTLLKGAQFFLRQYDKSASQGKQRASSLVNFFLFISHVPPLCAVPCRGGWQ